VALREREAVGGGDVPSRLDTVSAPDLTGKLTTRFAEQVLAMQPFPELYATLGNSPPMLSAWLDFAWTLRSEPTSDRGLRELLILLVGARRSAPYCVAAHRRMAIAEDVPREKIDAVAHWVDASCFSDVERACLDLADAMLAGDVSASQLAAVTGVLGESQVIEIVLTVAFYMMVAAVTTTLDLAPEQVAIRGEQDA